jgi:hypothetical protein
MSLNQGRLVQNNIQYVLMSMTSFTTFNAENLKKNVSNPRVHTK